MATVHVMEYIGASSYRFVLHVPMPAGNNAVGTPWKTCYLAGFLPKTPVTAMPVGNGPGQISQNEANSISSGDLMEFDVFFTVEPGADTARRNAVIDSTASDIRNTKLAELQERLQFFGYTRP
jgi:hypothetical protein